MDKAATVVQKLRKIYESRDKLDKDEGTVEYMGARSPSEVSASATPITAEQHRTKHGAYVLVGEAATLAGVAQFFVESWTKSHSAGKKQVGAYEALGMELFRFATEVAFGSASEPSVENISKLWLNGTRFALPILVEDNPFTTHWSVDTSRITAAEEAMQVTREEARTPAAELVAFDAYSTSGASVKKDQERVIKSYLNDVSAGNRDWRDKLRWNPYAAVLPIVQLLTTLKDAPRVDFITQVFGTLNGDDLASLRKTSAGSAMLRLVSITLSDANAAPEIVARIATTFGVETATNLRLHVEPAGREPPAPSTWRYFERITGKAPSYIGSYLGRRVEQGIARYEDWEGPSAKGIIVPKTHFQPTRNAAGEVVLNDDQRALLKVGDEKGLPLSPNQLADRLLAIKAIFESEGNADAIRAADKALISIGLQQFSVHVEEEASVVLRRFRALSEAWFEVLIRSSGFDVDVAPADTDVSLLVDEFANGRQPRTFEPPTLARPAPPRENDDRVVPVQLNEKAWLIRLGDHKNKPLWCVPGSICKLVGKPEKVNISVAAPAVVTYKEHKLRAGAVVKFAAGPTKRAPGRLPGGLIAEKPYYVLGAGLSRDTFQIAESLNGAPAATTSASSGELFCTFLPRQQAGFPYVKDEPGVYHTDCRTALGYGDKKQAGKEAKDLLLRWAIAVRFVPEAIHAQVEVAVYRFTRVRHYVQRDWKALFADSTNPGVTLEELFPSTAHAAALVDCFINTPETTLPAARRAYERVQKVIDEVSGAEDLRLRTLLAFLSERHYTSRTERARGGTNPNRGSANSVSPPRVAVILDRLQDSTLNPDLGDRTLRWTDDFNW
jgi:hypothetical protein